jgi:galactose-1-phosphate uridylyltransferase
MWSGALGAEQFFALVATDVKVTRHALANKTVQSVLIRKNQGPESGASQPHVHHQIIGSPDKLPALEAEVRALATHVDLWLELIDLADRLGLLLERGDGVVTFQSPIGIFPRSYDIVMPGFRGLITELGPSALRAFARAIHRLLRVLGPLPLDYEIHQDDGVPLHVHLNARLFPYSNVAGTLNLPGTLLEGAAAMRHALQRI